MLHKLKMYADFIKIEHTLFALPFAYAGAFLAAHGWFGWKLFLLITAAFTGMRTAAMVLNRIIDRDIDAINPRTAKRHLPAGLINVGEAYGILIIALSVYFVSAYLINRTAFMLSPIPVITAWIYPYLKRFTCLAHFVLGLNLAFAPLGGWIAVTDSFDPLGSEFVPAILGVAVIFWVAGFDIIYGLQDVEFDRKHGLHSIGAHYGVKAALAISAISHAIFFTLAAYAIHIYGAGVPAAFGLAIIALLLIYQHLIVNDKKYDEKRIQIAFFHANAVISAVLLFSIVAAVIAGG
ncbi:UbiA-like polyprenyltransferase [Archaeoglobus veneficus]|uniref:4-hydroxybenzoate polyprenyltransferase n=1 Tax=Archaeoglobus veneficus (strain DSM 11195 / SNP6) TaxID=693661 RepID=F2KMK7_ARCVS|nr:UbiA-like polyprenyltransferase [Archaeoglobus veneficus]AEA47204.1 4-hydroxybenzoate polyprenyltransferase [Archaeoglobus veneficus SNP6]